MRNTFDKLDRDLNSTPWLPLLGLALAAAVAAGCGGDSTGSPGGGGSGGSSGGTAGTSAGGNSGGGTTGSGGTSGSGGSGVAGTTGNGGNGSGGNSTAGAGGSSTAGAGGNTGAGGNSTAGSGGNAGGSGGTAGNGGGGTTGGAQAGRGGASAGSGGASAGGRGGSGGTTGTGGTTTGCPANATFCSAFDTTEMPAGAVYNVNAAPGAWTRDFAIDTAVKHAGNSALRVKLTSESGTSGSSYKMLSVPATQSAFWARFWVRSEVDMGGLKHNTFAMACPNDVPDKSNCAEFAEDVGTAFNTNDDVRWPEGYGRPVGGGAERPYILAKNTWHCVEISFDGTNRVQQLYLNGAQLINATNYPAAALTVSRFKFGFAGWNGPDRVMWYDDVAVAPTRIGGCS